MVNTNYCTRGSHSHMVNAGAEGGMQKKEQEVAHSEHVTAYITCLGLSPLISDPRRCSKHVVVL